MTALAPTERMAFTDALRPPPGYFLEAGLGTSFSLDFDAFTAVMLAFVGADVDDAVLDTASALTAVARLRSRLAVFVNAGGLHEPHAPNRLFALYDRITRSVVLEKSAFHPKVWALRFAPQSKPELKKAQPVYRVLCASRNVTDSGCWELGALFDGTPGKGSDVGADVAAFCRKLASLAKPPPAVWKLIQELPRIEFARGREADESLRFRWQWPGGPELGTHLPHRATRAIVISPFVRARFVEDVLDRVQDLVLVSTQEELDALPDRTHERLANTTTYVVTGIEAGDVPALDLHAKLLAWEKDGTRETLVGSANATGPGWGIGAANCEAMMVLRPGPRIDDVLRSFIRRSDGQPHPWVEEYVRQVNEVDDSDAAERRLNALQRDLAKMRLRGSYDGSASALTIVGLEPIPACLTHAPDGVAVALAPLMRTNDAGGWQLLAGAYGEGLRFPLDRADLCAFAIVELTDAAHGLSRRFGLQFDLALTAAEFEQRDEALHARLLENLDARVLLLNVLRGVPAGSGCGQKDGRAPANTAQRSVLATATIERVLEVCTADPSRIDEVDALLGACKSTKGMESFVEFWGAFKSVLREGPR